MEMNKKFLKIREKVINRGEVDNGDLLIHIIGVAE